MNLNKFQTSPPRSPTLSTSSFRAGSPLPAPAVYRQDCMSAAAKRYKYLRRLVKFQQMDFEFALWQMWYLFVAPQKVYRNFHYRKETKSQFARDDPAFLVLFCLFLCVSSMWFTYGVLGLLLKDFFKLLLYVIFVDCIGVGLITATFFWFVTNRYLRRDSCEDQDVEWGYAFDVHLNAFFPLLVILHGFQLFLLLAPFSGELFIMRFLCNTLWLIALGYYIYINFLGYSCLPILHKTHVLLYPMTALFVVYVVSITIGWNMSTSFINFYKARV
ncbi:protein unc-50 homolog [Frankliniella occidentalis]|uniref:Protein unc-50 homolog n=1 Tax=Frankliniella occidentalis TaxID=133901 RepID=A0A6J1SYG0_FRAOC|nr:protein unc-50 homolog [Frankliniella occidentalis]WOR20154.1 unc-50 protein [Frankliniella occidentalis]